MSMPVLDRQRAAVFCHLSRPGTCGAGRNHCHNRLIFDVCHNCSHIGSGRICHGNGPLLGAPGDTVHHTYFGLDGSGHIVHHKHPDSAVGRLCLPRFPVYGAAACIGLHICHRRQSAWDRSRRSRSDRFRLRRFRRPSLDLAWLYDSSLTLVRCQNSAIPVTFL